MNKPIIEIKDITPEELHAVAKWLNNNSANMCQLLDNVIARHNEKDGEITYYVEN